jgi:hypothetical protein
MIDDAFGICRTHLELTDDESDLWKRYISDFIHSRIILPTADVYQTHRGVPSGSAFTSIIGSIVNLILTNFIWIRTTGNAPREDRVLILGDDVVVATDSYVPLSELASAASELGFTLSPEKSSVVDTHKPMHGPYDNRVHFLGHYWVNGVPRRPVFEILQRMAYPERHARRTKNESIIRMISYLADCRESWGVLLNLNPQQNIIVAVMDYLDQVSDEDVEVLVSDLPGRLRYQIAVEGDMEAKDALRRGLTIAVAGMYF